LAVYSAVKKDGRRLDKVYISILIMCTIANAIVNHYEPPSVIRFPCVRAVVFAFSMHHTQCKKRAIRNHNCRPSGRRVRDVTRTRAGVTDEPLPRKSVARVQGTSRMTSQGHASEFMDITRHHTYTSWNHGYKDITENGRACSHFVPMILQWPRFTIGFPYSVYPCFRLFHETPHPECNKHPVAQHASPSPVED